ncbi:pyruvate kinase alpha/beta domain-containing protein [candidate division CSSED10-310 bacterium]|uniref:Pyruvate kinase alpha/beta domain-containing protein n=1 Tax=candidate division CSSED10-310 bacterium TaxID=2855610 RepID=A0ABV6Z2E5_UNCC1
MTTYHLIPGSENTQRTLTLARECALSRGIRHLVVASTSGRTGKLLAEMCQSDQVKVVIVTHNRGFQESEKPDFDSKMLADAEHYGAKIHTGTMVTRGLGRAIRKKTGYSHEDLIAHTLRILGEGTKVCVEIAAMAFDAGLIDEVDIIAIAGTHSGADTACIISPKPSNLFFDIRIKEFIAKPGQF